MAQSEVEHIVYDAEAKAPRRENKTERTAREQRETLDAARRDALRLQDWHSTLAIREMQCEDGIKAAKDQIERNEHSLRVTRDKKKKAARDLEDARDKLARLERAAAVK